ncbi:MAG: hypothetical protein PHW46_06690 [Candidatus Omnitrophica bacterium]|nr:hypothetical protein [Candidatus Omnitrophota bacterium]
MKRKLCYVFMVFVLSSMVLLSGCAQLKDKFVRKPKKVEKPMRYIPVREYEVHPSLDLYTKRYIYWKNWHNELLDVLDDSNHKKKVVAAEQAMSNLMDMQHMLTEEKAEGLQKYIDEMTKIEKEIKSQKLPQGNVVWVRKKLESLGREVKRDYSYNKVRGFIADDFRE